MSTPLTTSLARPTAATRAFLVAFVLFLGACAPIRRTYTEPTSGKLARIRVSTDGIVWVVPNNRCRDFSDQRSGLGPVAQGPMFNHSMNDKKVGIPGSAPTAGQVPTVGFASSELLVQAEEPLVLGYGHEKSMSAGTITTTYTCKVDFLFVPKEGYDYAALAETTPDGRRCRLGVAAIGDKQGAFGKYVAIKNQYDKAGCEKAATAASSGAAKDGSEEGEATSP